MTMPILQVMPVGGKMQLKLYGGPTISAPLNTIPSLRNNSVGPIHHLLGRSMGDPKRPRFGMAYLLLVPAQEAEEERRFGLVVVWVHPSQTLLPSLEEAARKLTLLINIKEDWPYAFAWVCKDSQHTPSPMLGTLASW